MFLITKNKIALEHSLTKLRSSIISFGYPCGTIAYHLLDDEFWLGWFRCKPADNLHIFANGVAIGKLQFGEPPSDQPKDHDGDVPLVISPLLATVFIYTGANDLILHPNSIANVYCCDEMASDMQLLLAHAARLLPSAIGTALLSVVGYFPGNETLFDEIKRIPYLYNRAIRSGAQEPVQTYTYRKNDDMAMLERLTELVPKTVANDLLVTGGFDSRTLAYCLQQSGGSFQLLHMQSAEVPFVEELARQLHVPLTVVPLQPRIPDFAYAILTDAQIYAHGGNHQSLVPALSQDHVAHTGHFVEALNKFPWNAAYKRPKVGFSYYRRLIRDGLLQGYYSKTIHGLRDYANSDELAGYLEKTLDYTLNYCPRFNPSELARWYFFIHRGLRWSQVVTADMSFATHPVFLSGDLTALEYGVSSSAFSNFAQDRIRLLLAKVMPTVTVGYSNGQARHPRPHPLRTWDKLYYEYGERAVVYIRANRKASLSAARPAPYQIGEHARFRNYFAESADSLFQNSTVMTSVKRTAVVVNQALHFVTA